MTTLTSHLAVYTDGACAPNPGGFGGVGLVIVKDDKVVYQESISLGKTKDSLAAEWSGIMYGSERVATLFPGEHFVIVTDNQKVAKTLRAQGKYVQLVEGHGSSRFNHIADSLASRAVKTRKPHVVRSLPLDES